MPTQEANNTADGVHHSMPDTTASEHSLAITLHSSEIPMTSEDKEWNQERWEFLKDLPPDTREYKYTGFNSLSNAVKQEHDRFIHQNGNLFVVFTDVPPEEIENHENHFPGRIDYNIRLRTLILNMPAFPHEIAAEEFDGLLMIKTHAMGIREGIMFRGATRTKTKEREKEADRALSPLFLGAANWPTIAVEVAYTESAEQVKKDVAFWLNQSNGEVRKAISIDIEETSRNIHVTSWERGTPTTQFPQPDPEIVQAIKIYPAKDRQQEGVDGDDLLIPFKQMVLRDPVKNAECDLVITKNELLATARKVWVGME